MRIYDEEDYLSLSGIQHYEFCRRQWALIHIEQQWSENLRTIEGQLLHQKAHDGYSAEKRGNVIISRGMPVFSRTLGVTGQCDIVEFYQCDEGVELFGKSGRYKVLPVEYKRGAPKDNNSDVLQLVAQAICLGEMLCSDVKEGRLFYGETKHRIKVEMTDELKQIVIARFEEMHHMYERRHTPKAKQTKSCNACSLKNVCLPKMQANKSAHTYIAKTIKEGNDD